MKKNTLLLAVSAAIFFAISLDSCKKCDNEPPRARILNYGTDDISVQIMTSGGNTVNINNIKPDSSSAYASYAAGAITFTVKRTGVDYVKKDTLENCTDYDISVSNANVITTKAIAR